MLSRLFRGPCFSLRRTWAAKACRPELAGLVFEPPIWLGGGKARCPAWAACFRGLEAHNHRASHKGRESMAHSSFSFTPSHFFFALNSFTYFSGFSLNASLQPEQQT